MISAASTKGRGFEMLTLDILCDYTNYYYYYSILAYYYYGQMRGVGGTSSLNSDAYVFSTL